MFHAPRSDLSAQPVTPARTTPAVSAEQAINPLNSTLQPPVERSTRTPRDAADLPGSISRSRAYRWLGLAECSGIAGAAVLATGATIMASGALAHPTALLLSVGTGLLAARRPSEPSMSGIMRPPLAEVDGVQESVIRVREAVQALAASRGTPPPDVRADQTVGTMGTRRTADTPPVVVVDPTFIAHLNDQEVEALVAHELSHHANRYPLLCRAAAGTRRFAETVTAVGVFMHVSAAGAGPLAAVGVALGVTTLTYGALQVMQSLAARAAAIRTDLRAIDLCGDPDAYLTALRKTYPTRTDTWTLFHPLRALCSSHLSLTSRTRWIRAACDLKSSNESRQSVSPLS
jgi:Zn-dependent protease with chaperone function